MCELSLEERLNRIERKVFPENIIKLYDYTLECNNCMMHNLRYVNCKKINYPSETEVCSFCGGKKSVKNIYEHDEVSF